MPIFDEITTEQFRQKEAQKLQLGEPILDAVTMRLTAAVRAGSQQWSRGKQTCSSCGATTTGWRCTLPNGGVVYTFSIHNLAFHRDDHDVVTEEDVLIAFSLQHGEATPTSQELALPNA